VLGPVTFVSAEVEEFAGGTAGSAVPMKTLTGPGTLTYAAAAKVDSVGNLYLLTVGGGSTGMPEVMEFGPGVRGADAPAVVLTSGSWTGTGAQLAVH